MYVQHVERNTGKGREKMGDNVYTDDYKHIDYGGLKDYQAFARNLAVYPEQEKFLGLIYTILGLNGEAGEVAEKLKKYIRDSDDTYEAFEAFRSAVTKELGDVLWYLANVCEELNISLADVAANNLEKLYSRMERDVLHGSGDDR